MRRLMTSNSRIGISVSSPPIASRLLIGVGWALLGKGLTYPAGLALTMLLARLLPPIILAAYILLAPVAGFLGVAIVAALSISFQNIMLAYVMRKKLKMLTLPGVSLDAMKRFIAEVKKKS